MYAVAGVLLGSAVTYSKWVYWYMNLLLNFSREIPLGIPSELFHLYGDQSAGQPQTEKVLVTWMAGKSR
jgi:hypothetical protein